MVARALKLSGPFEGILGLGLPNSSLHSVSSKLSKVPEFLGKAKISRFSVCFNAGADGVLRLSPPALKDPIGNVGRAHWALDFGGFSVGDSAAPSPICSRDSMRRGQETP